MLMEHAWRKLLRSVPLSNASAQIENLRGKRIWFINATDKL